MCFVLEKQSMGRHNTRGVSAFHPISWGWMAVLTQMDHQLDICKKKSHFNHWYIVNLYHKIWGSFTVTQVPGGSTQGL